MKNNLPFCYCGSEKRFTECCEPYIQGVSLAPSAEALMRSRYSAFCLKDITYLLKTLVPLSRKDFDQRANEEWANQAEFLGLKILESTEVETVGWVKFEAFFRMNQKEFIHRESSTFRKIDGVWYFEKGV